MSYGLLDAAKDFLTGSLEFASEDVVAKRIAICEPCEVRNSTLNTCTACGCFLPAKTKLLEATCPMELW